MARLLFLTVARILPFLVLHLLHLSCAYTPLADETLQGLPSPGEDFNIHTGALLSPILRPRVPGTPNSTYVLNHFIHFFESTLPKWTLTLQKSTSTTPATGSTLVPFTNLIATRDPPWSTAGEVSHLTLAAHYDSKLTPTGFIGAIDSAAPCAMLLHAARSIDAALTKKWESVSSSASDLEVSSGIQILLLDGEEAFADWTSTDSLYGARSLAESMENTPHPALSTFRTAISSISLFVLLDLLGAPNPTVPSFFKTTHWAYQNMAHLESRLRALSLFTSSPNYPSKGTPTTTTSKQKEPLFLPQASQPDNFRLGGLVDDDHVPFMARGVDVLHLIPIPFPVLVWHKIEDDGEHLDLDTCDDWALLITAFMAEWMELEGFFEAQSVDGRWEGMEKWGIEGPGWDKRAVSSKTEL